MHIFRDEDGKPLKLNHLHLHLQAIKEESDRKLVNRKGGPFIRETQVGYWLHLELLKKMMRSLKMSVIKNSAFNLVKALIVSTLGSVWYICLKTKNCFLKIFVEIRVGEKMYENT